MRTWWTPRFITDPTAGGRVPECLPRFAAIQRSPLTVQDQFWLPVSDANIQLEGYDHRQQDRPAIPLRRNLHRPARDLHLKVGFVTRDFQVDRGTVRYFGTPDLNAELDIPATHTVQAEGEDIPIIAKITGTLLLPKLSLESTTPAQPSRDRAGVLPHVRPPLAGNPPGSAPARTRSGSRRWPRPGLPYQRALQRDSANAGLGRGDPHRLHRDPHRARRSPAHRPHPGGRRVAARQQGVFHHQCGGVPGGPRQPERQAASAPAWNTGSPACGASRPASSRSSIAVRPAASSTPTPRCATSSAWMCCGKRNTDAPWRARPVKGPRSMVEAGDRPATLDLRPAGSTSSPSMTRALIITNPAAARTAPGVVQSVLDTRGVAMAVELVATGGPGDARRLARGASDGNGYRGRLRGRRNHDAGRRRPGRDRGHAGPHPGRHRQPAGRQPARFPAPGRAAAALLRARPGGSTSAGWSGRTACTTSPWPAARDTTRG